MRIDNRWPTAVVNRILHDGSVVGTCAIVDSGSSLFAFDITASDAEGHLKSWYLGALWGDNASDGVASDSYDLHLGGAPTWAGVTSAVVPAGSGWDADKGTPESTRCAHTFYLDVWDRVINGWGYIHQSGYHKSITLMLP